MKNTFPWYTWPLIPFAFCATLVVMIPFGILALLSIPYFYIYPDRHVHIYDIEGTDHQQKRLAQWRGVYRKLGFLERIRRAWVNQRD